MKIRAAQTIFGVAALALLGCQDLKPTKGSAGSTGMGLGSGPKVKLEFYVMSKCPFGTQVEDGIKPVLDEIGDRIDFRIDYIVNEQNGQFSALHGQPEVDGNIVQLCAMKYYPDPREYMKFIECQNKEMREIPGNWERCAQQTGLDKGKLDACFKGAEGKDLLRASMKRAQEAKASGSPTIKLAGEDYNGGRSKMDFMRAICEKMPGTKPEACAKIPEEPAVHVTILNDKRCTKCATAGLEANLKARFFPKLVVKQIEYGTDEGKALFKELALTHLPAWLFDADVEKSERYTQIKRWLMPKGKYQQLRVPASFDPTAEICDNKIDDTGDGKIDCDDATCKAQLVCREEKKNDVQVFVMSQCPFGVKALDAMKEVLDNFKGTPLKFDVHYIADKTPTGFNALHGQPEVDENIRHLCAKKYYGRGNKYLDYIWCRNKNYRSSDWKPCATGGIDAAKIEKCAGGPEGAKLLEEDIQIAKALDVSGSPTWLANNRHKFSGITAEAVKTNICQHNPELKNCDKKLTAEQTAPSGSCGN